MASSNLLINNGVVKDDLNCVECKSVPKDACLVPCGCRLCRICINDLLASGVEFCPGSSDECQLSLLSQYVTDYRANKNISKLSIKCPNNGCVHACQLANMEEHLRVCPRKSVECPFRELGCTQDKLAAEEMSGHLQRESLSHNEILIGMINNINNEMEGSKKEVEVIKKIDEVNKRQFDELKKSDESHIREYEILKNAYICNKKKIEVLEKRDESKNREIEMLKKTDENNKKEIAVLKEHFELLNVADRSYKNEVDVQKKANEHYEKEVEHLKVKLHEIIMLKGPYIFNKKKTDILEKKDENMKTEIEIMKTNDESNQKETECLTTSSMSVLQIFKMLKEKDNCYRSEIKVRAEKDIKIPKKTNADNRREINIFERDSIMESDQIKIPSKEITVKNDEAHECDELDSAKLIEYVYQKITSFEEDIQSINQETESIKAVIQSLKSQIQAPVKQVDARYEWMIDDSFRQESCYFYGAEHPYKYQLASCRDKTHGIRVYLRIWYEEREEVLPWPFCGTVTITVTDSDKPRGHLTETRLCKMNKPLMTRYKHSGQFEFLYPELIDAGVDIHSKLRVTCSIAPSSNNLHSGEPPD